MLFYEKLFVRSEPLLCQSLVFGAGTAIIGIRINGDSSTWSEKSRDLYIFRVHERDKILHYDINAILVKISVVTEAEKVELKAFALHHLDVRDVTYPYLREVRLPRNGTKRGEFRAIEPYPIIVAQVFVDKCLQHFRSIIVSILGFLT